tara:strand:+ start:59 stop:352 length:294 start_codon:yes stop_codon:yes gene_type:complete
MSNSSKAKEFVLPLELQFTMRKVEISAGEMTWEQLYSALVNLYYQRLMEWQAIKALVNEENIELDFDIPTDIELQQLASTCAEDYEEEDEDDPFAPA